MTQQRRLGLVLVLNLLMIAGLLIVGIATHSLGLLAAGGDYAADSAAILLGIMAIQIAKHPRRFAGFAALPMQYPEAAANELERCVRD